MRLWFHAQLAQKILDGFYPDFIKVQKYFTTVPTFSKFYKIDSFAFILENYLAISFIDLHLLSD